MDDDSRAIDKGWDALPNYADKSSEADDAVTVSLSTTPGEWLVNTVDAVVVPMSMAELVGALQTRKLTERSLVWRAGMQEWAPVERVPQLKLAARLPIDSARPSTPPRPTLTSKPPPKPVRATPAPPAASAVALPSRKATLPFGLPTPATGTPRPTHARPSSSPRASAAPPKSEEPEVLAVYDRPAATISFDISPEKPLRAEAVAPPAPRSSQPQTLAPLTSDSAPRRMSPPPNADLSVVAAAHFRQAQKSSKRLVLASSIVSAAAASLLTFWIAHHAGGLKAGFTQPAAPLPAAAPLTPPPAPPHVEPAPPEPAAAVPAVEPLVAAAPVASTTKPKASHRPRPSRPANVARPAPQSGDAEAASKEPSSEPNPYDVKLEEDAPKAKPKSDVARSSGLEDAKPSETASGAATPGF